MTSHDIHKAADVVEMKFLNKNKQQNLQNGISPKLIQDQRQSQLFNRSDSPPEILILRNPLAENEETRDSIKRLHHNSAAQNYDKTKTRTEEQENSSVDKVVVQCHAEMNPHSNMDRLH